MRGLGLVPALPLGRLGLADQLDLGRVGLVGVVAIRLVRAGPQMGPGHAVADNFLRPPGELTLMTLATLETGPVLLEAGRLGATKLPELRRHQLARRPAVKRSSTAVGLALSWKSRQRSCCRRRRRSSGSSLSVTAAVAEFVPA